VQCFGGAKNHMIVMPDADMDQAVDALIGAGYGSAGERCMAISVAVPVGKKTADRADGKADPARREPEDRPLDRSVGRWARWSPSAHLDKVKNYVDIGVKEGAKLVVDGRGFKMQGYENGFFMGGCLFDNVTKDMRIYKEEIFGPVLSVVRAKTTRRRCAAVRARIRQRRRDLHPRRRRRARLRRRSRSAWSASTCRSRCRSPITPSAAGSAPASATSTSTVPDSIRFYTKTKTRDRGENRAGRPARRKAPSSSFRLGADDGTMELAGELLPDRAGLRLGRGGAAHPRGARRRPLRAQRPEAVHLRRRQAATSMW
jgi:malonate-semialdehyde dehydrogenase (acetylating)/methylmalonate-semialdehyde dehydrogenase